MKITMQSSLYFLLFITLLINPLSIRASDLLVDIENIDAQFFEQAMITDSSDNKQESATESSDDDTDSIENSSLSHSNDDEEVTEPESNNTTDTEEDVDNEFPHDEYEHYMSLIKTIDPIVYEKLRDFEAQAQQQALEKTTNPMEEVVCPPSTITFGYPFIVMKSLLAFSEEEQVSYLTTCVAEYHDTLSDTFSKSDYDYYMELIKGLDLSTFRTFKSCATALQNPCLLKATPERESNVLEGTEETFYYPILILPSIKNWDTESQISLLASYVKLYNAEVNEKKINNARQVLSQDECAHILRIVYSLSPKLFQEIIRVDPTGEHHSNRCALGAKVVTSLKDGLPIFSVSLELFNQSFEEQRWVIGHELGHYVLEHFKKHTAPHPIMNPHNSSTTADNTKITFGKSLKQAASRIEEYEADTFSIMNLGTDIDAALNWMQRKLSETKSLNPWRNPIPETFKSTHPQYEARIKHLESLRLEVELQKARGGNLPPIDWDTLIKKYKNSSWEKLQETL